MLLASQRKSDGSRARGAFTLVELTVVVAITAVLASLLLPALSGAKEKSRRAVCQNNLHEVLMGVSMYANDHNESLPSSGDNFGYYHSIRLSDETFTNFVYAYLDNPSILYCPNVDYTGITNHDKAGFIIGYSYLSTAIITSGKGPDYWVGITKLDGRATNEIFADANYWAYQSIGDSGTSVQIAPHTSTGGALNQISPGSRTASVNPTSQSMGARGGNIGRADMSVTWKSINSMGTYPASNEGDAEGNW